MEKTLSRRHFIKAGAVITTGLTIAPSVLKVKENITVGNPVRLGGPVPGNFTDPVEWIKAVKSLRYSAAYCPVEPGAPAELVKSFRQEAAKMVLPGERTESGLKCRPFLAMFSRDRRIFIILSYCCFFCVPWPSG